MTSATTRPLLSPTPLVILVADLTGYARGFHSRTDAEMASFLDRFYRMSAHEIEERGGRVIKFIGDAVLATFPPDDASAAVAATVTMQRAAERIAADAGLDCSLGANIHLGDLIGTELGAGASRRFDVVGRAVNQAFLLGRGRGIRMSERAYRTMPSGERSPWEKRRPPVVYVLGETDEPYVAGGKTPVENAERW